MGKNLTEEQRRRLAELRKEVKEVQEESAALWRDIEKTSREEERFHDVLVNADKYLGKIEESFEQRTGLTKTDSVLLFVSTALQLFRIYVLPKIKDMCRASGEVDNSDFSAALDEQMKELFENHLKVAPDASKKFKSWNEIVSNRTVPYDAACRAGDRPWDSDSRLFDGDVHEGRPRMKVLGQDPLFGWIFGVANIMTDTVSICPEYNLEGKGFSFSDVETYEVDMGPRFCWQEQMGTWDMFEEARASYDEDKHRLYAAIFAQGLHQGSGNYSALGLPVPNLSSQGYDLYSSGYDYLDSILDTHLAKVFMKSGKSAMLINGIIAGIHQLFYDSSTEPDRDLYSVRTKRIVLYSNLIATGSDVVQAAIRADAGDADAIKNLDWGGLVVTMFHLIYDTAFIMKIKEEFVFKEWERLIMSDDNILNT